MHRFILFLPSLYEFRCGEAGAKWDVLKAIEWGDVSLIVDKILIK